MLICAVFVRIFSGKKRLNMHISASHNLDAIFCNNYFVLYKTDIQKI